MATLETSEMLISRHKDITVTGRTNSDIVRKWEGLAYGAQKSGDYVMAQEYFQQAEGWKKRD